MNCEFKERDHRQCYDENAASIVFRGVATVRALLKNHRGRCPLRGRSSLGLQRAFSRQEAGDADLIVRQLPRPLARTCLSRGRARTEQARTTGMIERGARGTTAKKGSGRVCSTADTFAALKQTLISGGESESSPRECACTCRAMRDTGEGEEEEDRARMESMRSLYSARQKRLVRYQRALAGADPRRRRPRVVGLTLPLSAALYS